MFKRVSFMPNFSGKKSYQDIYSRQAGEIRDILRVLEFQCEFDETDNRPKMDMYEADNTVVVEFDLPGFSVEDISLKICGTTLVLEAYRPREKNAGRFICLERTCGNFRYVVQLPLTSNPCEVSAEYRLGVLRVTCPRSDGVQVPIKEITP